MSKKDLITAGILGVLFAVVFVPVHAFVVGDYTPLTVACLLVGLPLGFMASIYIGGLLSKLKAIFLDLTKFALVGLFNTGLDFAVFNGAIFLSRMDTGWPVIGFKSISFLAALLNSYFWNKTWTFKQDGQLKSKNEFLKYVLITVIGFLLNIGITAFVVNYISVRFGFTQVQWDNLAAGSATVISLLWNFTGYKVIVFKTKALTA